MRKSCMRRPLGSRDISAFSDQSGDSQ